MHPTLRNILAVLAGIVLGGILNMTIINITGNIVSLPAGVNPNDIESIKQNMHLYEAKHFVFPFLAHALGSLLAGFVAAFLSVSNQIKLAIFAGGFFIIGGIMMAKMLPAPIWFEALDVIVAYFPMAFLGGKLAINFKKE
ncbi:MAG: hypothetical protein ACPGR5_05075 [Chitinophagales bacterium]